MDAVHFPCTSMNSKTSTTLLGTLSRFLAALLLAAGVATAATSASAQITNAIIHGQVSNQATKSNLEGVIIRVAGVERETLSRRDGTYEIAGLKPDTYHLTFDYPGLDSQQIAVELRDTSVRKDVALNSRIYVLESFSVAAEREGNAAAIAAQKAAIAPTNIVSSDAFGNIAKGNVGNFLRRIPGITGTTDEADTDNVQLRGMSSGFTAIDIDGVKYATANGGRGQSVQGIPTDMIERIEVVKSPTPDTDSDSLGGRINMITRSAYDRKGRQITLRAANTYSFTYDKDVGHGRGS